MCDYAFLYVLPRYEARRTSRLVRYIEVYVIASQFCMELMLFRRGLSVIVRNTNSEVYVISRVVLARSELYMFVHIYTKCWKRPTIQWEMHALQSHTLFQESASDIEKAPLVFTFTSNTPSLPTWKSNY